MGTLAALIGYQTKAASVDGVIGIGHVNFAFTEAELVDADCAMITAFTNPIVFTVDDVTPTSTLGIYLAAADVATVRGNVNVMNLQFIKAGATAATVSVTLFKFS